MPFKAKLEKQVLTKLSQDLMNGASLEDASRNNSVSYQVACYYRKKLVRAGVLNPLYRTTRRKKRTAKTNYQQSDLFMKPKVQPTVVRTERTNKPFTLVVNETTIDITGSKHVNVTPDKVYIKY